MRGPPLQVAGLPLVHPLRWEVRWELLVGDQDEQVPRHHLLLHQPGGAAVTAGAPAVLGAAGFTSSGVAGGSLAAAVQVFHQLT